MNHEKIKSKFEKKVRGLGLNIQRSAYFLTPNNQYFALIVSKGESSINDQTPFVIRSFLVVKAFSWAADRIIDAYGGLFHDLNLAVYEPANGLIPEKFLDIQISHTLTWNDAVTRLEEIKYQLMNNKFTYLYARKIFNSKNIEFSAQTNPDDYLKPLDIVKRKIIGFADFMHVGIYLGNKRVCHIINDPIIVQSIISSYAMRITTRPNINSITSVLSSSINVPSSIYDSISIYVKISTWEEFVDNQQSVTGCHSIVKNKSPQMIINHLKKTLQADYGKGQYQVLTKNCEHFANLIIHGFANSNQVSNDINAIGRLNPIADAIGILLTQNENEQIQHSLENVESFFDDIPQIRELTSEENEVFSQLESYFEVQELQIAQIWE